MYLIALQKVSIVGESSKSTKTVIFLKNYHGRIWMIHFLASIAVRCIGRLLLRQLMATIGALEATYAIIVSDLWICRVIERMLLHTELLCWILIAVLLLLRVVAVGGNRMHWRWRLALLWLFHMLLAWVIFHATILRKKLRLNFKDKIKLD